MRRLAQIRVLTAGALLSFALAANVQASDQFYSGKTIELDIGYTPGGGYDTYARLMARHLGKHIPGNPQVVPRNMPGGGGRVLMGYMSNVAGRDGLTLAVADQSMPLQQALRDPSIHFDVRKLIYIGNPDADINTVAVWSAIGVRSVQNAQEKEVVVASTGPNTSSQIAYAMNATLGTKFRVVMGYPGGNEMNFAMERGEVGARVSNVWATWKATKPDWVRDRKITIIAQVGLEKAPDLPGVPLLMDLAKNDVDRGALRLLSAPAAIGRPLFTTPGVPADRVKTLRNAFDAMVRDAEFLDDAKRQGLEINPTSGEQLQKIVMEVVDAPASIIDRLAEIIKPPAGQK